MAIATYLDLVVARHQAAMEYESACNLVRELQQAGLPITQADSIRVSGARDKLDGLNQLWRTWKRP